MPGTADRVVGLHFIFMIMLSLLGEKRWQHNTVVRGGRFGADSLLRGHVGSGHWTNGPTAGQTFYLTKNKATAVSAYEYYEFHGDQETTAYIRVKP